MHRILPWVEFKINSRIRIRELSRDMTKTRRKFFGYIDTLFLTIKEDYGFEILDVISKNTERSGVICFSPELKEIYREIPKESGWKYRVIREALKYDQHPYQFSEGGIKDITPEEMYRKILDFGFIEMEVVSGEMEDPGIIIFSPDGTEFFREIPRTPEWEKNLFQAIQSIKGNRKPY